MQKGIRGFFEIINTLQSYNVRITNPKQNNCVYVCIVQRYMVFLAVLNSIMVPKDTQVPHTTHTVFFFLTT